MEDRFDGESKANPEIIQLNPDDIGATLQLVGAVDISYCKTNDRQAVAAIIICKYPSFEVIYEDYEKEENTDYPYIPGFLAFKEIPVYKILFERLKQN